MAGRCSLGSRGPEAASLPRVRLSGAVILMPQPATSSSPSSPPVAPQRSQGPLEDLEHWDEFLQQRYPDPAQQPEYETPFETKKAKAEFRDYRKEARPGVKEFYRLNHANQTVDFVQQKKRQYLKRD